MTKEYEGKIGTFQYDNDDFNVSDEDTLKYVGKETDGNKITVPSGVVDGTGTFEGTAITSGANLPDTLKNMTRMYYGCSNMKTPGTIPSGVNNIDAAYGYTGITETPDMPDSITSANFAYDHCADLEKCDSFPQMLKSADGMFAGDTNLKKLPDDLPDTLRTMDGFACDCQSLQHPPRTNDGVLNMDNAYASCQSLKQAPYIPSGASAENVTTDCYALDNQTSGKAMSDIFKQSVVKPLDRAAAEAEVVSSIEGSDTQDSMQL